MAIDQEILEVLEDQHQELCVKDLAMSIERFPAAFYKPLARLVQSGLVNKTDKLVKGKWVAFYSVPSEREIEGCRWQDHKEILLAGKTYRKDVLSNDFWPSFAQDIQTLQSRQENRHIAVVGLVGWGKSTTAIWISKLLDPSFAIQDIIFVKQDLLRLVASQPKNKSFVLDDVGVMLSSRQWQEKERELIFGFLEICRMNQVNTIATAPSLAMIDVNYQRLLHYVLQVELKCQDHIHIIVFKPTQAGLKPTFKPVGVLYFPYPESADQTVKQYQELKQEKLSLSARESLERLETAKVGVQRYVLDHPVTRVTDDVVGSALESVGLNGNLPKQDKHKLRIVMFDALQGKKQKEKVAKTVQVKQGKENLRKARLSASYRVKYQAYIDKGRSESFAKVLSYRLTFQRSRAGNLKNLAGVMGSLSRKVKPVLVENLILDRLDDPYLVRDLRALRDILGSFKLFDIDFYTKIFAMLLYDSGKAMEFIQHAKEMRSSSEYRYHGKFSPKRWRQGVEDYLSSLEADERQGEVVESVFKLGAGLVALAAKKPEWMIALDQKKPVWWDQ